VARLTRQADDEWEHIHRELQTSLEAWTDDLRSLGQVETEIGVALDQLQEMALAVRVKPVAEILSPLQSLVQDVAHHQGKLVELDVTGADIELDYSLLNILARPVRRLVWFAVAQGIESPTQRREAGKPAAGRVSVVVSKAEDYAQIVVTDDGRGLDREGLLRRARELSWTDGDSISTDELSQLVVRDGFGMVGGVNGIEGIDLAAINAALQTRQGWLSTTSQPGQGTRFRLELPLDMAVIDGLVVRVGSVCYVVPLGVVRRIVKPEKGEIVYASANNGQNLLRLGEELVPIQILGAEAREKTTFQESLMLVVEKNEQAIALAVDELIGQQQVLSRPLQGYLADIQNVSGYALLGDGEVGMILNLNQMNIQNKREHWE
jgi:two-component system chemotaxis sensor kinase CheA